MMTAHVLSSTPSMIRGDHIEKNTISGTFSRNWKKDIYIYIQTKTYKGKGKGHPRTGHEGPEGEWRYSSTLSLTSA